MALANMLIYHGSELCTAEGPEAVRKLNEKAVARAREFIDKLSILFPHLRLSQISPMSKNTDQRKICRNPYCFEETCKGECLECEPVTRTETCLSEDGEFTQYIEPTPLRSKYFYETTIGAS